jgi:[ribosomal protein S5]-alanine N-acetyltransferase
MFASAARPPVTGSSPRPTPNTLGAVYELRPIRTDDAPAIHDLLSDAEVAAWLRPAGETGPFSATECEAFAARSVAHWDAHGFGRSLAFVGDRCIGWSHLGHTIATGRGEVELGWTVARGHWGQGLATGFGADALARARELGLRRVVAFTRHDNLASRRVMEKLDLLHERDFEYAGWPHVLYREPGPQRRPDFVTRG